MKPFPLTTENGPGFILFAGLKVQHKISTIEVIIENIQILRVNFIYLFSVF